MLILLGVSSKVLGGELETQICLGWRELCLGSEPFTFLFWSIKLLSSSLHHFPIYQYFGFSVSERGFLRSDSLVFAWGLLGVWWTNAWDVRFTTFPWGNNLFRLDNTFLRCTDVSKLGAPICITSGRIPWGLLGVCLGCDEPMLGDVRFYDVCLGIWYFFAWGWIFRAVCLGMWFSGSCLLGDVDIGTSFAWGFAWGELVGSVRQGCSRTWGNTVHFENQSSFKSWPVGKNIHFIGIYWTDVIALPISKKYKSYLKILNGRKSCANF